MVALLGELIALGAVGILLAGAAAKALEAEKVRVGAEAKNKKRRPR